MKYRIYDWKGNHKFPEKEFDSHDDGWDFLIGYFRGNDEELRYWEVLGDDEKFEP